MRLKSAPQKVNFLMAKIILKIYTLNCSHKCLCTFPHCYALLHCLVFEKNHFMSNNSFYSLGNQKLDKTNSCYENNIEHKYEVKLDSFPKFACVSSYLYLKDFAWKRD